MSSLRHIFFYFFLVFLYFSQTLASNLDEVVDPDVLCSVTNHTSDGLTSYEIKCQKMSKDNKTIGCCAIISNENGLSYEWGSRCGARDDNLRDIIDIKSTSDPTATTCALKIIFHAEKGMEALNL